MREIKFRSKCIFGENSGRWMYGMVGIVTPSKSSQLIEVPECNGYVAAFYSVDPKTTGQFIGLKDHRWREIYEGDVLDIVPCSGTRYIGVVVFNSRVAGFEILFSGAEIGFPLQDDFDMEILGNIFDDPELDKQFGEVYRKEQ